MLMLDRFSHLNVLELFLSDLFVGNGFVPGEGIDHAWNAVFISGSWRLLDCTWGAGKTDAAGQHFKKQLDEHFFIADPDELIYTHFPYDEVS
jgi:transglutaminase/protease-like cytokinesis protein 3